MKNKIFLLLFLTVFSIIIWKLNILSIEKIKILNFAECVSINELNTDINNFDKNLLLIAQDKFKSQLTLKYKCIKDISVNYEFPKTINVNVYGRKFLAKVYTIDTPLNFPDLESTSSSEAALLDWNFPSESSEDALTIDDTGFVFTKVRSDLLIPTIFLPDGINFGTKLDTSTFNSIDRIFSKVLTIEPFSYQPNFQSKKYGSSLLINTSPKIAFSLENDILKQLASLQLILQKAKIDERVAEFIDLRFDKPVVQYRTNSSK